MSRVPITIDVNRYICSELEILRKMPNTHDYSQLSSVVERMQMHANAMEEALYKYSDFRYGIEKLAKNSDNEFKKKMIAVFDEYKVKHEIVLDEEVPVKKKKKKKK